MKNECYKASDKVVFEALDNYTRIHIHSQKFKKIINFPLSVINCQGTTWLLLGNAWQYFCVGRFVEFYARLNGMNRMKTVQGMKKIVYIQWMEFWEKSEESEKTAANAKYDLRKKCERISNNFFFHSLSHHSDKCLQHTGVFIYFTTFKLCSKQPKVHNTNWSREREKRRERRAETEKKHATTTERTV